jgi:tetratricopeptide (TPR) repeat protein
MLACIVGDAFADDIVVLPPIGATTDTAPIASALKKTKVGKVATVTVDATCAGDPGCLTKTGSQLNAKRIVAIVAGGAGQLDVTVVDVGAKLLLGTRSITVKKADKELGPALGKLVESVTVEKAKALFAEGNQHYNIGEFQPALDLYKLAYRVKPLPAFQFNIAQCHRKLGQHKDAIAMYQAYLVGVPDAPNKDMVESLINESQKAWEHDEARKTQLERDRLAAEEKKAEEARKAKEADAAAASARAETEQARIAAEREREKTYNRHPARKWMIATSVVGLAGLGAGGYFGLQTNKHQDAFDSAGCGDPEQLLGADNIAQCQADRTDGKNAAQLSNAFFIGGGAVLLASVIVFAIDPGNVSRPEAPRAAIKLSPTSIDLVMSW